MTDVVLMAYFIKGQVGKISLSVKYIIRSRTGIMDPRGNITLQREIFLWIHLESTRNIELLGRFRVGLVDLGMGFDNLGCLR